MRTKEFSVEIIKLGADFYRKDKSGTTIGLAFNNYNADVVNEILKRKDQDITSVSYDSTPLIMACSYDLEKSEDIPLKIIEMSKNVKDHVFFTIYGKQSYWSTALICACDHKMKNVINKILEKKPKHIKTMIYNGKTAIECAKENKMEDVVEILKSHC